MISIPTASCVSTNSRSKSSISVSRCPEWSVYCRSSTIGDMGSAIAGPNACAVEKLPAGVSSARGEELAQLLAARSGEALDLHAEYVNPQMVRVLRIIGFDREWARAEGAYLYDRGATRYLDWLGGFGMFNVGRNNPTRARRARELLELETPSLPQLGLSDLPGLLAEALVRVAPARDRPRPLRQQRHRGGRGRDQARPRRDRGGRGSSRSRTASTG